MIRELFADGWAHLEIFGYGGFLAVDDALDPQQGCTRVEISHEDFDILVDDAPDVIGLLGRPCEELDGVAAVIWDLSVLAGGGPRGLGDLVDLLGRCHSFEDVALKRIAVLLDVIDEYLGVDVLADRHDGDGPRLLARKAARLVSLRDEPR